MKSDSQFETVVFMLRGGGLEKKRSDDLCELLIYVLNAFLSPIEIIPGVISKKPEQTGAAFVLKTEYYQQIVLTDFI